MTKKLSILISRAAVLGVVLLMGCGGQSGSNGGGGTGQTTGTERHLFVLNNNTQPYWPTVVANGTDTIVKVSASSDGNLVTPLGTITGPVGYNLRGMALDESENIYVVGANIAPGSPENPKILVYSGSANTSIPVRTIEGSNTRIEEPIRIAVDSAGQIYISCMDKANADMPSILVFAAGANGNVAPIRVIVDPVLKGLGGVMTHIAVDGPGNVYVFEENVNPRVAVFAAGANGQVAPVRTFVPRVGGGVFFVDKDGNFYTGGGSGLTALIGVYPAGVRGAVYPARTIGGSEMEGMVVGGLCVDPTGRIYASLIPVDASSSKERKVVTYRSDADGEISPDTQVRGATVTVAGAVAVH